MLTEEIQELPDSKVIRPRNLPCAYCGCMPGTGVKFSEDHVIGRRFVPKGMLENQWNLILNVCEPCNGLKSDLEDDISAITMQPDMSGMFPDSSSNFIEHATGKAHKSFSRKTSRLVKDSKEKFGLKVPLSSTGTLNFNFVGPPQIDEQRAFKLARYQLAALHYWITFNHQKRQGYYWQGAFAPIHMTRKSDWGNPVNISFVQMVQAWEPRFFGITADGFFKVVIRKNPDQAFWSWALEWNKSHRLVGFYGEEVPILEALSKLPKLTVNRFDLPGGNYMAYRTELTLAETDDFMFDYDRWLPTNRVDDI